MGEDKKFAEVMSKCAKILRILKETNRENKVFEARWRKFGWYKI